MESASGECGEVPGICSVCWEPMQRDLAPVVIACGVERFSWRSCQHVAGRPPGATPLRFGAAVERSSRLMRVIEPDDPVSRLSHPVPSRASRGCLHEATLWGGDQLPARMITQRAVGNPFHRVSATLSRTLSAPGIIGSLGTPTQGTSTSRRDVESATCSSNGNEMAFP